MPANPKKPQDLKKLRVGQDMVFDGHLWYIVRYVDFSWERDDWIIGGMHIHSDGSVSDKLIRYKDLPSQPRQPPKTHKAANWR